MIKNHPSDFSYEGSLLLKARKKLRISREEIAQRLTLNTSQIQSLEENLDHGFATPHFRKLAIIRYAEILNISIHKIITTQNTNSLDQKVIKPKQTKNKQKPLIFLFILFVVFYTIYNYISMDVLEISAIAPIEKSSMESIESSPIVDTVTEEVVSTKNSSIANDALVADELIANSNSSFICTIGAAPVTHFKTKNPDKPSNYFHLKSITDQSICAVDSQGNLKNYSIKAGNAITHAGNPPFKIQLNPSVSRLYFQGWIIHLSENDKFIQLDPASPETTN